MIKAENLTKTFEDYTALSNVTCTIPKGCIYGMVGSNGAGKSTFLRLITGIYKPNEGMLTIDELPVYENPTAKERIAFVPDELYFLPGANMVRMAKLYESIYSNFSMERFDFLAEAFRLDKKKNIHSFSKGMKRQVAIILALSSKPDYLIFDETFDGLDPIMRKLIKGILMEDVAERKATVIITSHSLRELEDTCDQLALLHKGGLVLQSDVDNLKTSQFKIQIAFPYEYDSRLFKDLDVKYFMKSGSVSNLIIKGNHDATIELLQALNPILLDVLPLTLEEVFMYEMEALGYNFSEALEEF
ncbi:MAG: ABC transporter ATP-binding protein [bacterium]|nr:ABC transporter ATP-binding protein [bacterium]